MHSGLDIPVRFTCKLIVYESYNIIEQYCCITVLVILLPTMQCSKCIRKHINSATGLVGSKVCSNISESRT